MSAAATKPEARVLSCEQMQLIARALADPRRYGILVYLASGADPATSCATVRACVEVSPATLSHHMRELQLAGLVKAVKEGREVSYVLCRETIAAYTELLRGDLL